MKLTTLADVTVYRMHVPRWAVAPTSGAGAAKYGGRANRPGVEALYLAMKTETAIQEFQQVSTLLPGAVPRPALPLSHHFSTAIARFNSGDWRSSDRQSAKYQAAIKSSRIT